MVFIYIHRGPTHRGGQPVKVSSDESKTWHEELYFLTAFPSYPGYSGSGVLSPHLADGDSGVILSVVDERAEQLGQRGAAYGYCWCAEWEPVMSVED